MDVRRYINQAYYQEKEGFAAWIRNIWKTWTHVYWRLYHGRLWGGWSTWDDGIRGWIRFHYSRRETEGGA